MNAPFFYNPTNASSNGEETNKDPNYPVVNPMSSDDFNQTGLHLVDEQPVAETVESINPLDELHAFEKQFEIIPYQESPVEESVAKSEKVMLST